MRKLSVYETVNLVRYRGFSQIVIIFGLTLIAVIISGGYYIIENKTTTKHTEQITNTFNFTPSVTSDPKPTESSQFNSTQSAIIDPEDYIVRDLPQSAWENPDEQFKQGKVPQIYTTKSKIYPKNFSECVKLTKEIRDVPETFKLSIEKRRICYWESNRKYSPELLQCPNYGKEIKQTLCGDLNCQKSFYICKLQFINPNFKEPQNYNECIEWDGLNCNIRFDKRN